MLWDKLFRRNFRTQMTGLDVVKFQNIEIYRDVNLQFVSRKKVRTRVTFVLFRLDYFRLSMLDNMASSRLRGVQPKMVFAFSFDICL